MLAIVGCLAALLSLAAASAPWLPREPTPHFRTHVVAFEDTMRFGTPREGSLVYRTEGRGRVVRAKGRWMLLGPGAVSLVHPAQYDTPTVVLSLTVVKGEPAVALCHNGMRDTGGVPAESLGFQVVFGARETRLTDLSNRRDFARIREVLPRGTAAKVAIACDVFGRTIRVDMPRGSYLARLPERAGRGGFALRCPVSPPTEFRVTRARVEWTDRRDLVLYDGWDTVYDRDGRLLGRLQVATLPVGNTNYATNAVDLRRERSLIVFGGPDLNSDHVETIKGFAVRDLRTGKLLDVFGPTVNGCRPMQGGGGMDGFWLLQSWLPPASTCWLDWNAYDRGEKRAFVVPHRRATKDGARFVGFHDPSNALDGSMARFLWISETWRGVNQFTVHPNLAAFAPFSEVAMPPPSDPLLSHTGPAGLPTQLAVRDRDRAWYETWAYLGNGLHTQARGYNVFARRDDWAGPRFSAAKDAEPFEDWVNMAPDLLEPGMLYAPYLRFAPVDADPAKRIAMLRLDRLRATPGRFVVDRTMPVKTSVMAPFQMLMDVRRLKRDAGRDARATGR